MISAYILAIRAKFWKGGPEKTVVTTSKMCGNSTKPRGLSKPQILLSLVQQGKKLGCSQRLGALVSPHPRALSPEALTAEGQGFATTSAPGPRHMLLLETTGLEVLNAASFRGQALTPGPHVLN